MPNLLPVPYYRQIVDGYCLAACAQMVLGYWSMPLGQEQIARKLDVVAGAGVPASRIKRLEERDLTVVYDDGDWDEIIHWLDREVPVIAMIQAGELPQWRGETFQHAVVLIGYDATHVWLLDPEAGSDVLQVLIDEFMLAWGEMDFRYAILVPPNQK